MTNTKPRILREFKCETYHEKVLADAYQAALEEIEKLKKSYEFSSSSVVAAVKEIERLQNENEALKTKVARYEKALFEINKEELNNQRPGAYRSRSFMLSYDALHDTGKEWVTNDKE